MDDLPVEGTQVRPARRGLRRATAAIMVGLGLVSTMVRAQLNCNAGPQSFESALDPGWGSEDLNGSGLVWASLADCGEEGNFTGGSAGAACVSSDRFGVGPFDAALVSPAFSLADVGTARVSFRINYQSFSNADLLSLDLTADGGLTWTTLRDFPGDRGDFRSAPGDVVEVDLADWRDEPSVRLRFRYRDASEGAFDWYAQVDDVQLQCDIAPACEPDSVTRPLVDGGFESGSPSQAWGEFSLRFETPICSEDSCGFDGAASGAHWAFFGGSRGEVELSSLEQGLIVPIGIATLRFRLWNPVSGGSSADRLRFVVDGEEIESISEGLVRYRDAYEPVTVDLSSFADGGAHVLRFEGDTAGVPSHTNFFVDDVELEICTAVVDNPEIRVSDVSITEGNLGLSNAVFAVTLSGPSRETVELDYSTRSGTGIAGSDFKPVTGQVLIPAGTTTRTITVQIVGDTVDEADETFYLDLANPVHGVLTDAQGMGTIRNDDATFISISDAGVVEPDDPATIAAVFAVTLSRPSSRSVIVDYRTVEDSASAGVDFVAAAGAISFAPGETRKSLSVAVRGDRLSERDEKFQMVISNLLNAQAERLEGSGVIIDDDRGRVPVLGTDVTYTIDADFDFGRLLNATYETPTHDQLQLVRSYSTYPYLWVAASSRGTVVKVDTRTGTILGEYSTNPDSGGATDPDPSRTTVALDGSAWAGNRGDGSVVHVGLVEENQCIDRNGNGGIETSAGYGDVRPWSNADGADTGGGIATAIDECILHYVKVAPSIVRHVSVDRENDVWVSGSGGTNPRVFQRIDGGTGAIEATVGPLACGGYGGLIDGDGVVWSASLNGPVLRWDPSVFPPTTQSLRCVSGLQAYGLALDREGSIWVSAAGGNRVWKVSSDASSVHGPFVHGSAGAQGLAVDSDGDVWVSSAKWGGATTVGHLSPDGQLLGNVVRVPAGSTGIAVDRDGKVWVTSLTESSVARIDPDCGPAGSDGRSPIGAVDLVVPLPGAQPYNYSDMTGSMALASTAPRGTWTVVQDGGSAGVSWGTIRWNREAQGLVPEGAAIVVEARAAESVARLGEHGFVPITNAVPFSLTGRYLEARVTLIPSGDRRSPVLSDLRISAAGDGGSPKLSAGNARFFETNAGFLAGSITVMLSPASSLPVTVGFTLVDGNARLGADYARSPAAGTLAFPPGSTSQSVSHSVLGDLVAEDDEAFFLQLSNPTGGAVIGDGMGVGEIVDNDRWLSTVEGRDFVYTFNEDFDLGRQFNANHDAPGEHQLQVSPTRVTYPYLWIAASNRGTLVKLDTRTGAILGEYSTNPDTGSATLPDPSRTTVALDGSVWAGNRGDGSVVHVGLLEEGQCVDRNGNGSIETSTGYNNVLAWPNPSSVNSKGGVSQARDECILHYIKVSSAIVRHVTVDADNNLWVSGRYGTNNAVFNYVNGQTGQIMRTVGPMPCGGYGGLVDRSGIVWSTNQQGALLRWDPSVDPPTAASRKCIPKYNDYRFSYGIAADSQGNIWTTGYTSNYLWKIPPSGSPVLGPYGHGTYWGQGLAIDARDHIWVSSGYNKSDTRIGHVLPNGQLLGLVTGVPAGSSGVAIDAQGKIWVANYQSSTVVRIDPIKGPIGSNGIDRIGAVDLTVQLPASTNPSRPVARPYNYSDMTGAIALQKTAPRGTWEVIQDGGLPGTIWGQVSWNTEVEGTVPAGAAILVEARAADTVAGLGGRAYVPVGNDIGFTLVGRFLDVRVVLRPNLDGQSPVLSDLRIRTGEFQLPSLGITDVALFEGDSGSALARVALHLSSASTEEVLVDFDTVDGDATAPADYDARSGTAVVPAGTVVTELEIPVHGDTLDEIDESFVVDLLRPRGVRIRDGQGQVTILDDEAPAKLSVDDFVAEEGDSGARTVEFHVTLAPPVEHAVTVGYAFGGGTAAPEIDYTAQNGYLTLAPGTSSAVVEVQIAGDLELESDETFQLYLSSPFGAELADFEGRATILDDDGVEVSIGDASVVEGHEGEVPLVLPLAFGRPLREELAISFTVHDVSAVHPFDYRRASGTLVVAAGASSAEIVVPVVGDPIFEGDETLRVTLSAGEEVVFLDAEAIGTILDDESCTSPTLIVNGGGEMALDFGAIPGWDELAGDWVLSPAPQPIEGRRSFATETSSEGELAQTISIQPFAPAIATGAVEFEVQGAVRLRPGAAGGRAAIEIDLIDEGGQTFASQVVGTATSADSWQVVGGLVTPTLDTRSIRVRLAGNGFFDAVTLSSRSVPVLAIGDASGYEGGAGTTPVKMPLVLSCPVAEDLDGEVATRDGTATAFDDYLPVVAPFTIPSGETASSIAVEIVGDELDEGHEKFSVDLTHSGFPTLPVVAADPRGVGTILDDDFCQRTHGYWMEHTELWPVGSLILGGLEYDASQLLDLLRYRDRDMSLLLAKQLVATQLNLARGSEPSIGTTAAAADEFLSRYSPGSELRGPARAEAERLKDELDDYNDSCREMESQL